MKPLPAQWLKLVGPYRNRDWYECIELLQPLVERHPDDLATRLLLGALCLTTDQAARALVQFEKLLPLAVGQGDLYRALGAQKQLDRLSTAAATHDSRFIAIHQWFRTVRTRRAERGDHPEIAPAALLALTPDQFHRMAEESEVEDLGVEHRDLVGDPDAARVILYGRVRWSVAPEGESSMLEVAADALDSIALPPGLSEPTRLRLAPELPSACLKFDLAVLREERAKAAASGSPGDQAARLGAGPGEIAGAARAAGAHPHDPAGTAATPARERPVPDPLLEPTVAVGAPFERRRETRVSVSFESRAAMLGLAGSRVAPFAGRLFNLSPSGVGLGFPRAELLPARGVLEGALLTVEIQLADGEPPLRMTSRVRWVRLAPHGSPEEMGVMGLEFVLVSPREHARIQNALIAAARAGRPLDPAADPREADPGAAAA